MDFSAAPRYWRTSKRGGSPAARLFSLIPIFPKSSGQRTNRGSILRCFRKLHSAEVDSRDGDDDGGESSRLKE